MLPLLASFAVAGPAHADSVTVAVASNFAETARVLAEDYERAGGRDVRIVPGSTGKLHAQIVNGAPFDIFLSADVERAASIPAADDGRFIYAIGRLVVWSADPGIDARNCLAALADSDASRIAIAKPALAPYGRAAQRFLESRDLWERVQSRLVYGENVAQALQFAASGSARIAIVAESQLASEALPDATCIFRVPLDDDAELSQQAVLLAPARDAARAFFEFLRSERARATIASRGYDLASES